MIRIKRSTVLALSLLIIWLIIAFVNFINHDSLDIRTSVEQEDQCEIQNKLLIETIREMGVKSSEDAAKLWAKGVKLRNGAMQAAAMDSALQEAYISLLNRKFPNWVTGVSSPWVASYYIDHIENIDDEGSRYIVYFMMESSAGYYKTLEAELILRNESGYWKISKIDLDEELKDYTGF